MLATGTGTVSKGMMLCLFVGAKFARPEGFGLRTRNHQYIRAQHYVQSPTGTARVLAKLEQSGLFSSSPRRHLLLDRISVKLSQYR